MHPTPNTSNQEGAGAPAPAPFRFLDRVDRVLTLVALYGGGLTLTCLTLLSVFNVLVMRKALNAPIKGAEDILVLALVVLVAFAIPFGARTGAHIEIEVLQSAMSKGFARISLMAMKALGIVILAIMSWRLMDAGANAGRFGESSQTLLISFAPFYYLLSVATAIYCLVLILEIWQLARTGAVQSLSIPGDVD